jgi:hypothetical protein
MNEEELQLMVARARDAEGSPSQPPPGLVHDARTSAIRRRRSVTLSAGVLVAVVTAGVIVTASAIPQPDGDDRVAPLPANDKSEIAEHGGPCPSVLPSPTDDRGYGFGTERMATEQPTFSKPDTAWVCQYGTEDGGPDGPRFVWVLNHAPRRLDDSLLGDVEAKLQEVRATAAPQACTDDLGPRWMLVTSTGGDLTGTVVDGFGCGHVRLTDDPFVTAPGDPEEGGTVAGSLAAPGLSLALETWWDSAPVDVESSPTPGELRVTCTDAGPQIEATTVAAGPAGVTVVVDSTMLKRRSYLTYHSDGLSGGDQLDQIPNPATYTFPPGAVTIGCASPPGMDDIAPVEIDVVDPNGYWRTSSIADFGCPGGVTPSWAVGNGSGQTPEQAVEALLDQFGDADGAVRDRSDWSAEPAPTGYSGSKTQTWIGSRRGRPYASILVTDSGSSYVANPDVLCGQLE